MSGEKIISISSSEEDDSQMPYWLTANENLILKVKKSKYCTDEYERIQIDFIDIMYSSLIY